MSRLLFALALAVLLSGCNASDWPEESILALETPDSVAINPRSHYIAVIGDIQSYTMGSEFMPYFKASMDWLVIQQSFFGNIDAVLQVGDMTNNNDETEWNRALLALRGVAMRMPVIAVPGNHDYDWAKEDGDLYKLIRSRASSGFDSHSLPVSTAMTVVDTYDAGSRHNAVYSLTIGGRRACVVAMEFGPRRAVVEWARRHIAANPSVDFYILTHEWLTPKGAVSLRQTWCDGVSQFATDESVMSPGEIFQSIVKPYDNVIAVICGHHQFVKYLESPNDVGRPVPQMMFNLQYQDNGGNGMLQLWELPQGSDSVYTYVYKTIERFHHPDFATRISFSRARAVK